MLNRVSFVGSIPLHSVLRSERRRSTPMENWPSETSPIEKFVIGDSPMKMIINRVSDEKSLLSRASPMKYEEKISPMEFKLSLPVKIQSGSIRSRFFLKMCLQLFRNTTSFLVLFAYHICISYHGRMGTRFGPYARIWRSSRDHQVHWDRSMWSGTSELPIAAVFL